ncbi:MAG: GTP-binding protein [Collinsella aerofaciens]
MSEVQALVECPVIVGTAGHVDHGKSALIEALTGKNPDRLEVERRRGMTVELGFGELALPSGKIIGLVDVPGHAHYLRAMVQGATGIDVAVLVVRPSRRDDADPRARARAGDAGRHAYGGGADDVRPGRCRDDRACRARCR